MLYLLLVSLLTNLHVCAHNVSRNTKWLMENFLTCWALFSNTCCFRLVSSFSCLALQRVSRRPFTVSICSISLVMVFRVLENSGLPESCLVDFMCSLMREPSVAKSSMCKESNVLRRTNLFFFMLSSASSIVWGVLSSVKGSIARARRFETLMQSQRNGSTCCMCVTESEHGLNDYRHSSSMTKLLVLQFIT